MSPELSLAEQDRGAALDFSTRAQLSEWMDEPCSYEELRACLRDLAQVNRLTFAFRPTRVWLDRVVARLQGGTRPLHIVDVGSGQGDMLRYLADWAHRRRLPVRLTGIDLNPHAARAAAEHPTPFQPIDWVTGDAFSYAPPAEAGIDIVISSLFTHHLPDDEIVRFLRWMDSVARVGWFINDLHRGRTQYHLFRLLSRVAGWHRFVQHDGPVSIRRSFAPEDWQRYLAEAGLSGSSLRVEGFRPARLCVGRIK